ncbi:hypothetical protein GCM10011579_071160 [Streptomyces albiflavescens]|uniref:Uncharacterized protein n=1 Tax=Streptomyces albiflavescens TaxID=1623582 RepID=A0A917YAJ5_9ACTN|nr:hypothetical protein GCM10011579_071160 [Streptomyces albiflavescens]
MTTAGLTWAIGTVRDVPCGSQGFDRPHMMPVGHWTAAQRACNGACPGARMLPCAPTPGTEILTERIPVGSQNGDSAEGRHARGEQSCTYGGKEGESNASLEGLAG